MRIGIPNLIPVLSFVLCGVVNIYLTILFFEKIDSASLGATISSSFVLILCYVLFGFLSYLFKIVVLTRKGVIIIEPFKLHYKTFKFDAVENLTWDLTDTFKFGVYRKLDILTSSGYQISLSDLEFINYDRLEKWLIAKTDVKPNLARKEKVELRQAKSNRWFSLIAIIMSVFLFFEMARRHAESNIYLAIRIMMVLIICRLVVRLVHYQILINARKNRK